MLRERFATAVVDFRQFVTDQLRSSITYFYLYLNLKKNRTHKMLHASSQMEFSSAKEKNLAKEAFEKSFHKKQKS